MCYHNEDDYDCCKCCYDFGFSDGKHQEKYENEYKNWDQVNSYLDGFRDGFKTVANYWCCTEDFNKHEEWCVNYKE